MTTDFELKDAESLDIDNVLKQVEQSFDLKFAKDEFINVKTFGDLCDIIVNKIQLDHTDDCTEQQAFYKLRDAFKSMGIDVAQMTPDTQLEVFLPRQLRRQRVKELNRILGFSMDILHASNFVTIPLVLLILVSIGGLFFHWQYGLAGLIISIIGSRIATIFNNEMYNITVGQLAEKMTREYYLKSRRNPKTVNKEEIVKQIEQLFIHGLDIQPSSVTRDAPFS